MKRVLKGLMFAVLATAAIALFGFVVMSLWNWLTPALFGWHVITFWQALGLLILCKILFGGFRGGPSGRKHWQRRTIERWERMTPEEREKFRQGMQSRCGSFGTSATEPKA
jgi:hypothetical protein